MGRVESRIQSDIIAYLRGLGAYVRNIPGSAATGKGTADLLVCYRGYFLAVEVKRPDGSYEETVTQRIRRNQVTKADGLGIVVASIKEVADLIHAIDERTA